MSLFVWPDMVSANPKPKPTLAERVDVLEYEVRELRRLWQLLSKIFKLKEGDRELDIQTSSK